MIFIGRGFVVRFSLAGYNIIDSCRWYRSITFKKNQLPFSPYKDVEDNAELSILCCLKEEIAAINLAKYRKAQQELEEAEERAENADNAASKLRARNKSSAPSSKTSGNSVSIVESGKAFDGTLHWLGISRLDVFWLRLFPIRAPFPKSILIVL